LGDNHARGNELLGCWLAPMCPAKWPLHAYPWKALKIGRCHPPAHTHTHISAGPPQLRVLLCTHSRAAVHPLPPVLLLLLPLQTLTGTKFLLVVEPNASYIPVLLQRCEVL
jgi:hypothetical protein